MSRSWLTAFVSSVPFKERKLSFVSESGVFVLLLSLFFFAVLVGTGFAQTDPIPGRTEPSQRSENTMSALYNHAIRWEFTDKNPITGPVRGSGVRQSAKRERIPDLLEVEEFQLLQAELRIRERILVWLDMTLGLRRGELAGLRWEDIHFEELTVMAQRSVVDQVVGKVKTEASKRPIPIDPFIAEDLLLWYRTTKCNRPDDYVFATDAARAGKKRGKQPVWLSKVMSYRIQPVAKRLGIAKRIGWHTFRRTFTTLLHANGEDVKVVQELLRHGSARITMDVYAQAVTPAKRKCAGKSCGDAAGDEERREVGLGIGCTVLVPRVLAQKPDNRGLSIVRENREDDLEPYWRDETDLALQGEGRRHYLTTALFFCPRLVESLSFAAFRPGFFRHSGGSSSPSIGGFPCPARSRIRRVSARSALRPLSWKYSSVRKAEIFSATATLMSWFRATPSTSAALRSSSSKEGCSRNAKLLRLMGSHS
jgi:integrase